MRDTDSRDTVDWSIWSLGVLTHSTLLLRFPQRPSSGLVCLSHDGNIVTGAIYLNKTML